MSNPFKKIALNSQDTKSTFFDQNINENASNETLTCKGCGAPRPFKSDLSQCQYCRATFMNIKTIIEEK